MTTYFESVEEAYNKLFDYYDDYVISYDGPATRYRLSALKSAFDEMSHQLSIYEFAGFEDCRKEYEKFLVDDVYAVCSNVVNYLRKNGINASHRVHVSTYRKIEDKSWIELVDEPFDEFDEEFQEEEQQNEEYQEEVYENIYGEDVYGESYEGEFLAITDNYEEELLVNHFY